MKRIPRDVSSQVLIKKLRRYGYEVTRQTGSHIRLTTQQNGEHHTTVPNHAALRIGTLSSILQEVARHHHISKEEVVDTLF